MSDIPDLSQRRLVFREEIRDRIREEIFSGQLRPGDRIIETFWAKELGVSQGPVREAIRDLEAMGLVETIPFKGSRVRLLSDKDIRDNYSVRICLETKSLQDVITQLDDDALLNLTKNLQSILDEMDISACRGDLRAFTICDTRFHQAIIEATGNKVLFKLWEQCNLRNWFVFSALTDANSLKQLQEGHQRIFHAIAKRDIEEATSTIGTHITGLMSNFMKQ